MNTCVKIPNNRYYTWVMSPQEFRAKWDVTYSELAEICYCSEILVKKWFSRELMRVEDKYLALLAFTDKEWSRQTEQEESELPHWIIYKRLKSRS